MANDAGSVVIIPPKLCSSNTILLNLNPSSCNYMYRPTTSPKLRSVFQSFVSLKRVEPKTTLRKAVAANTGSANPLSLNTVFLVDVYTNLSLTGLRRSGILRLEIYSDA